MKSVLITGCNGGIGTALVDAFVDAGWQVIGVYRSDASPEKKNAHFIQADLGAFADNNDALENFSDKVRELTKSAPLACLVNNAAVQKLGALCDLEAGDIVQTMNVNVVAPILLAKAFLPELVTAKGTILNIGSVHAQATKPEFAAYATSKAALHGLTRALAVDLGPDIRVNTLAPAATATPMLMAGFEGREEAFKELENVHPVGRIASAEEIARMAVFLTTDDASFMSGSTLYADGGVLSRLHDPV